MAVSKSILGMNARNFLYINRYNTGEGKLLADNKLETKKFLLANDLPTPELLHTLPDRTSLKEFPWHNLPKKGFVIKPARGYAGAGIVTITKWDPDRLEGKSYSGKIYSKDQLETLILDILEGAYSLQHIQDAAFIEERVILHPFFKRLVPYGIPDIRIVVFNKVPVMSMLRLPTFESDGKANIHLGAIGVGIDIRTGITTHSIQHDEVVRKVPHSGAKLRGRKLPDWNDILILAASVQDKTPDLGYAGVDIVLDKYKGAMILELNARPGLSIQNANMASMRTRLERVEFMNISSAKRGVEIGRSLFAEPFSEKVKIKPRVIKRIEPVTLLLPNNEELTLEARIDTGADRTAIDKQLFDYLGLEYADKTVKLRSANGRSRRKTTKLKFILGDKKINTLASVTDRSHMTYPIIVGIKDLKGFIVDPTKPKPI